MIKLDYKINFFIKKKRLKKNCQKKFKKIF